MVAQPSIDDQIEKYDLRIIRFRVLSNQHRPFMKKARHANLQCIRRARKLGVKYENIALLIEELMERAVMEGCFYCGKPFEDSSEMTIEHIVPMSLGGTHTPGNIAICCLHCNRVRAWMGEVVLLDESSIQRGHEIAKS